MPTPLNPRADPWSPITPMLPHLVYHPHPPYLPPPPPPPPPYLQPPFTPFHHPIQLYNVNIVRAPFQHPQLPLFLAPNAEYEKTNDPHKGPSHWDAPSFSWTDRKKVETFERIFDSHKKKNSLYVTPPRFSRFAASSTVSKVRRKMNEDNNAKRVFKEASGSYKVAEEVINLANHEGKTSVMIRNIPNKFRRGEFLRFLDLYCNNYQIEYDFFYLPMDFMRHNNYGYAFVNFTTSIGALKIMSTLEGYKWSDSLTNLQMNTSKKVCQINWARIQGKEELVKHFQKIEFPCDESEYLPVLFSPPRNGSTCLSTPSTIGKLGGNQLQKRRL